jgi:hypothetical protein
VGGINEDADQNRAVTIGKLVTGYLTDLNTMVVDWRLLADRRQPTGDQGEFPAVHQPLFRRWGFEAGEGAGARRIFARQHADIRARNGEIIRISGDFWTRVCLISQPTA